MDVTTENFDSVLPVIAKAINECIFMSFDFELTGLYPHSCPSTTSFDTLQQRYEYACQGARSFIPIQFGLCTVAWDDEKQSYIAQTFNFFIHPYTSRRGYQFTCDLSSLKFLSSHNFDFNTLFSKGISFVSREKVKEIEENMSTEKVRDEIQPAPKDQEFVNEALYVEFYYLFAIRRF